MKKILALYLPQFHSIPENDKWWGKGYTEWTAVKTAKPYFKNHYQPKIPLNNNYYDLSSEDATTWKWQSELAQKYGIYGFAIYHYWFGNDIQLLQRPAEILLKHKEIKTNFCFVWANESWTRTWYGLENEVLASQEYGDKSEWKKHFLYLIPFFKDERYIKVNGKPMICIYRSSYIKEFESMVSIWRELAIKNGFPGLHVVVGNSSSDIEKRFNAVDAFYNFEPSFSMKHNMSFLQKKIRGFKIALRSFSNVFLRHKRIERIENSAVIYKSIEKCKHIFNDKTVYYGTFPMWDNTPRRGYKGLFFKKCTPDTFYKSLCRVLNMTKDSGFLFINAWNEWGEGCYLEPDSKYKFEYLEAVKKAIENENE